VEEFSRSTIFALGCMGFSNCPKMQGGYGFRNLEWFNLALLGKHGRRFITQLDSLCARVMKSKYFLDTDFMQETIPNRSYATWRAIVVGRDALSRGLIKCIGDGSSVEIWTDKWISGLRLMTPLIYGRT
jgi:hypothetical protein